MCKQLVQVLGVVRLKHIFRAFISPIHTSKVLKYHCRRVSEREFVDFLARSQGIQPALLTKRIRTFTAINRFGMKLRKSSLYIQIVMGCR